MAITTTTLKAAIDANTTTFVPTATTGATVAGLAKIDDEYMVITAIATGIEVRSRGALGTKAVAHNILAPVLFCVDEDVPTPAAGRVFEPACRDVVSYGVSGAIALPTRDTIVFLTKASASAMTLADPANVPDGTILRIVSTTAAAHTVALVTGYLSGDSSNSNNFTFAATVGASTSLMAYKGVWCSLGPSLAADNTTAGVTVG